jgi:hypothetical protein
MDRVDAEAPRPSGWQVLRRAAAFALALAVASGLSLAAAQAARADTGILANVTSTETAPSGSLKDTFFICPSVSTNNANGTWVIGQHGGYYVLIPGPGSKVFVNVPVDVPNQAQIPAGWALYNSLPNYPNFVGTAMLLEEGIEGWLGGPAGWEEFDMATVVDNGDGTHTVTNLRLGDSITIDHPVPLASAAVW